MCNSRFFSLLLSMLPRAFYAVMLTLLALLISTSVQAEPIVNKINMADVVYLYEAEILNLNDKVVRYASGLMFLLAGFAVVLSGIKLILLKQGDLQDFMAVIVRLCLVIGICKFLIINGYDFSRDIIASFTSMAYSESTGDGYQDVLRMMIDFFKLAEEFAMTLTTRNVVFYFIFMIPFYLLIVFIILNYVITYIVAFFVAVMGVIVIAFGVLSFTQSLAFNYIKLVLAFGLRMFSLCFIIKVGQLVISDLTEHLRLIIANGQVISIQDAGFVLFVMFFILFLSLALPHIVASLVYFTPQNLSPFQLMKTKV